MTTLFIVEAGIFAVESGLSTIKRIKRSNTAEAGGLPAAKSEKENTVAVEGS
ncbi:MAG TPA: hypothetical protein VK108_10755 [Pseudogracilibacillus sp.]|nr:hypothetical protein [Pseudogracilibacillus sp.]